MVLKRKRSSSELSSSTSQFGSSPIRPESFMDMDDVTPVYPTLSFLAPRANAAHEHVSGRTMKRFRDNRPSEDDVHQRTMNLLYSAQVQPPALSPPLSVASPPTIPQQAQRSAPPTQRSLHSFWKINSGPRQVPATSPIAEVPTAAGCEDCGISLSAGNGDAMDVDGFDLGSDNTCGACRKSVCSHCSVTNLGEQRRCLRCAGRRTW